MKVKYEFFILCLILILISLQASAASEVNQTEPDISTDLVGITNYDNEIAGDSVNASESLGETDCVGTIYSASLGGDEVRGIDNDLLGAGSKDIYISSTGGGTGSSDSPTDWTTAYSMANDGDTIYFKDGTYTKIINQTIEKDLNLIGLGDSVVLNANNNGRIFEIAEYYSVVINKLIFINGNSNNGSAIFVNASGEDTTYLTIISSSFTNHTNAVIKSTGNLNIIDSNFTDNVNGIIDANNTVTTISNSLFTGNNSTNIVFNNGNLTVINSNFMENNALSISATNADIVINNTRFTNNTASNTGIYATNSNLNIVDSTFVDNFAFDNYRNIYVNSNAFCIITGCTLDVDVLIDSRNIELGDTEEIHGIFNDGTNIYISQNMELKLDDDTSIRFLLDESKKFDYNFTDLELGVHTLSVNIVSGEGNNVYVGIPFETEFGVVEELKDVVYISPAGNGTGLSGSPTNWKSAFTMISNNATINFERGIYTNILNQVISNRELILNGTLGVTLDAEKKGRFFTINYNSNMTINNITFINGYTPSGANFIGIYQNSSLKISESIFKNNNITNNYLLGVFQLSNVTVLNSVFNDNCGEIFYIQNSNVTVNNSEFLNNTGNPSIVSYIGMFYVVYNSNVTVNNSRFINNSLIIFRVNDGNIILDNMSFTGIFNFNSIYSTHGAYIIFLSKGNVLIKNSNFFNFTANFRTSENRFGLFYVNNGELTVDNSTFKNISVETVNIHSSGLVLILTGGTVNLKNSKFLDVYSCGYSYSNWGNAGVFFVSGGNLIVNNSNFTASCYYIFLTSNIGAVLNLLGGNVLINNSRFFNYTSYSSVSSNPNIGLYYIMGGYLIVNNSHFENITIDSNSFYDVPGVFRINGGNVIVNNTMFKNVYSSGYSNKYGSSGVFFVSGGDLIVNNSNFTALCQYSIDRGNVGFVLNLIEGTVLINNSKFFNYTFSISLTKSAILRVVGGNLNISNSNFSNITKTNGHTFGGVLFMTQGTVNIDKSNFLDNYLRLYRWAALLYITGGNLTVNDSKFINNSGFNLYGERDCSSVLYTTGGNITFNNSIFRGNVASSSSINNMYNTTSVNIINSIIENTGSLTANDMSMLESETIRGSKFNVGISGLTENIVNLLLLESSENRLYSYKYDLTSGNFNQLVSNLNQGFYQVILMDANNNSYIYKTGGTFTVSGSNFFIASEANGTGISQSNPANFTWAYDKITAGYIIYFLEGTYYINKEIAKAINLTGIGNVVLNGNGNTILTIKSNTNITNLHFTNADIAIDNQATTIITDSKFTNNTQHISNTDTLTLENSEIQINSNSKLTHVYDKYMNCHIF